MRFASYTAAASAPNVIVDGASTRNTVLTLSHWPRSGTPAGLRADTSAEIVFRYLDAPAFHVDAELASNNHFDEDGLLGIFALVDPERASRHRDLVIDASRAGDFGTFQRRDAARVAFVLSAYADSETSPLDAAIFRQGYLEMCADLYTRLLDVVPAVLDDVNGFRKFWEEEDASLSATEGDLAAGRIVIDERKGLDFAVVRIQEAAADHHAYALHNATGSSRLLVVRGRQVEFQYRYEGWVQMASRRPAARVDLTSLANRLNQDEHGGGRWTFDGVDQITPRLHLTGAPETSIDVETIVTLAEDHLRHGTPAWNPYG